MNNPETCPEEITLSLLKTKLPPQMIELLLALLCKYYNSNHRESGIDVSDGQFSINVKNSPEEKTLRVIKFDENGVPAATLNVKREAQTYNVVYQTLPRRFPDNFTFNPCEVEK